MDFGSNYLAQAAFYISLNLTKAVTAFIQPKSPLFWPFAVSALLIAIGAAAYASRAAKPGGSFWSSLRGGFGRDVWWNASARADYRLYFSNALLLPGLFAVVLFSEKHVVGWLDAFTGGTTAAAAADAGIASRVAFTLLFFVAYDFGRFVAHSLLHDVPVLWEFHKVHHSAETLNPMTTFRAHPLDLAVMAWVPALTAGVATWLFNKFTAAPVSLYLFLELNVLIFAFNLIGILRHSHVWVHYGPVWGKWFISPAHHQLHHSREPEHLGANRGFELAVWDRIYGTLYVPGRKTQFRMGLGDGTDGEWHNVRRMYVQPFVGARERLIAWVRPRPQPGDAGRAEAVTDAEPKERPG